MSRIMIVGNVVKDVYLNLDSRIENVETDSRGIQWLNLGFDKSGHKFFNRSSCLGGAAISLEILQNMGVSAHISGSNTNFSIDGIEQNGSLAAIYRYILVLNEQATYFSPSYEVMPEFVVPDEEPDYIFIDRSVKLFPAREILEYLDEHPNTKLAIHAGKTLHNEEEKILLDQANLVFAERNIGEATAGKIISLMGNKITCDDIEIEFEIPRLELSTHLSAMTIVAATILGGITTGRSLEESCGLARINVEHSSLDRTLPLAKMTQIYEEEQKVAEALMHLSDIKK